MSMTDAYESYLGNLGGSRRRTDELFGQLLSGNRQSRQDVADRYAMMGQQLADMSATASGQARSGYGAARNRVQAAPQVYRGPVGPGLQAAAAPSVGMDAATAANLQSAAGQFGQSNQAALQQVYNTLSQSEAANRASRLSDIDLAQTSDLAQLAALAQAQQFGMGAAQAREMADLDAVINQISRDQIAASLGFDERELSAINAMTAAQQQAERFAFDQDQALAAAERFQQQFDFDQSQALAEAERAQREFDFAQDQAVVQAAQSSQVFDQNAVNSAVNMFTSMVNPIVDTLEPESLLELWLAFSEEIGMPMSEALGSVGAV